MTDDQKDQLLGDCLEEYHRRKARGELPDLNGMRERLGDLYEEFQELMLAETAIDHALAPGAPEALPMAWGAYTLLRELGRGAAGVVYEALHRKLGRKVALKVLRTGVDTDASARERFRREAQALAQVRHDNIVEIFEFGEQDGRPFYAMALVEGPTLADMLRDKQRPDPQALCLGLAGVADALQALHEAGIIHRDVKPSNIMVAPNGRYTLADFGLARTAMATTVTRTGDALGTPLYMSPEQMLGNREAIEARTDVYGFGATFYQLLTGRPPFKTDDLHALMRMILTQRPEPASTVDPKLPAGCNAIAMKCLEKQPEDRYASAADLARDLRAFAAGERVSGRPLTRLQRGRREVLRLLSNPYYATAAGVLVAAGLFFALKPPAPARLSLSVNPAQALGEASIDEGAWQLLPLEGVQIAAREPHVIKVRARLPGFGGFTETVTPEPNQLVLLKNQGFPEMDYSHPVVVRIIEGKGVTPSVPSDFRPPRGRERGDDDPLPLQLLSPRAAVRAADLTTWDVVVNDLFDDSGHLEFTVGDKVLARVPFPLPATTRNIGSLPPELLEQIAAGDTVTWGFRSERSGKLSRTTSFTLTDADVEPELTSAQQRVTAVQDDKGRRVLGSTLRAGIYLRHGLALAAHREVQAAARQGEATLYQLAQEKIALETLFPDRKERRGIELWHEFSKRWNDRPEDERESFLSALRAEP